MSGVRWTWLTPEAVQVPVRGGSVFLLLDTRITIIDGGYPDCLPAVLRAIRRLGRRPEEVERIIVTHAHPDHIGGVARMQQRFSAQVAAHGADAPIIGGARRMAAPLPWPRVVAALAPLVPQSRAATNIMALADGEVLPVLGGVHVVHTPGHTPGHIALWLPSARLLISGDALQRRRDRLRPPAHLFTSDWPQALRSIRRLAEFPAERLALSHFPPVRSDAHRWVQRLAVSLPMPAAELGSGPP